MALYSIWYESLDLRDVYGITNTKENREAQLSPKKAMLREISAENTRSD